MKTLILLRHGESPLNGLHSTDYDRVLSSNGKLKVRFQGSVLCRSSLRIDGTLVSAAQRTKESAVLFCNEVEYPIDKIDYRKEMYEAALSTLKQVLEGASDSISTLLWVGHNPGISQLESFLTGEYAGFSPGDMSVLELEIDSWATVFEGCATKIEL